MDIEEFEQKLKQKKKNLLDDSKHDDLFHQITNKKPPKYSSN